MSGDTKKGIYKKNFMAPFYRWSSTASRLEPLRGGSLLFTTKFPDIPGTYSIDLRRMKGWADLWSHPVVLNTGALDWESSILTTRPLQIAYVRMWLFFNKFAHKHTFSVSSVCEATLRNWMCMNFKAICIRFLKPVIWIVFHFMFYVHHLGVLHPNKVVPKINLQRSCLLVFSTLPGK